MVKGFLFFILSVIYSFFFGNAMQQERATPVVKQYPASDLKGVVAAYLAKNRSLLDTRQAQRLPEELKDVVSESIMHRIKAQLTPVTIGPEIAQSRHHFGVCGLQGVSDARQIVSVDCDGKIVFCDEDDLLHCKSIEAPSHLMAVCLRNADQKKELIVGGVNGHITIWDYAAKSLQHDIRAHSTQINALSLSGSQEYLVSASIDTLIKIWKLANRECIATLKGHTRAVKSGYLADDQHLVSGGFDRTVKIWDLPTATAVHTYQLPSSVNLSSFVLRNENSAAAGLNNGVVCLWDIRQRKETGSLEKHDQLISAMVVNHNGDHIATGSWDNMLKLWDVRMLRCLATMAGHDDWVQSASVLGDFEKVLSGSRDGTVKIWDTHSFMKLNQMPLAKSIQIADQLDLGRPNTNIGRLAMLRKMVEE